MVTENGITPCGNWKDIAARKRTIQEQAMNDFLKRFNDTCTQVNGIDVCDVGHEELRESLARGSVQAETVTIAYIRRYNLPALPNSKAHANLCCVR